MEIIAQDLKPIWIGTVEVRTVREADGSWLTTVYNGRLDGQTFRCGESEARRQHHGAALLVRETNEHVADAA